MVGLLSMIDDRADTTKFLFFLFFSSSTSIFPLAAACVNTWPIPYQQYGGPVQVAIDIGLAFRTLILDIHKPISIFEPTYHPSKLYTSSYHVCTR